MEAVLDDVSYIRESTVYGVQLDDTDGKPGMAALACDYEQLDVEGLYQHCRAHLPEYAVPVPTYTSALSSQAHSSTSGPRSGALGFNTPKTACSCNAQETPPGQLCIHHDCAALDDPVNTIKTAT